MKVIKPRYPYFIETKKFTASSMILDNNVISPTGQQNKSSAKTLEFRAIKYTQTAYKTEPATKNFGVMIDEITLYSFTDLTTLAKFLLLGLF
jgi:hypothetical protein